ncbi:DnaJ domain-containing protein [Candidatus Sumerlaeota bacterium]|nr:DnaJ domain-containing protein [Candidatus Sumerlaeota bacterium]
MAKEKIITFDMLEQARKTLGLGETASLSEIKKHYTSLIKKYHPDAIKSRGKAPDDEDAELKIRQINEAYEIIISYCHQYRYSFRQDDFHRDQEHPSLKCLRQFSKDGIWSLD